MHIIYAQISIASSMAFHPQQSNIPVTNFSSYRLGDDQADHNGNLSAQESQCIPRTHVITLLCGPGTRNYHGGKLKPPMIYQQSKSQFDSSLKPKMQKVKNLKITTTTTRSTLLNLNCDMHKRICIISWIILRWILILHKKRSLSSTTHCVLPQ